MIVAFVVALTLFAWYLYGFFVLLGVFTKGKMGIVEDDTTRRSRQLGLKRWQRAR